MNIRKHGLHTARMLYVPEETDLLACSIPNVAKILIDVFWFLAMRNVVQRSRTFTAIPRVQIASGRRDSVHVLVHVRPRHVDSPDRAALVNVSM
jgi:hypothetical protein